MKYNHGNFLKTSSGCLVSVSRQKQIMVFTFYMSRIVRKPDSCLGENKGADQLRGNREADQRLCFRYTDSIIPLLSKSKISSLWPSSVTVQAGLCRTWSETQIVGFLMHRLISCLKIVAIRALQCICWWMKLI